MEEIREIREPRDRREIRTDERRVQDIRERRDARNVVEEPRDRREIRVDERRHVRPVEVMEQFSESEMINKPEKRHKRSHKHEKNRDRDREKIERDREHREKQLRESMGGMDDDEVEKIDEDEIMLQNKEPKEMTEQELRKER